MQCQEFEKEYLLSEGTLSAEARAHARECSQCRELLLILNLLSASGQKPAPELDEKTISAAMAYMHPQRRNWLAHGQKILYFAAAALILLLAVINFDAPKNTSEESLSLQQNALAEAAVAENISDSEALWYLNIEEASHELDKLELQLYLYANMP